MPKKLGEFLKGLIIKAGQNPEDEKYKGFLDTLESEAPDELINALDHHLLSVKDAQNNHPDIKKFYDSQTLDRLDKDLISLVGEDEELKAALNSERSTFKKIPLLIGKIKELESKKAAASSKPDKDAIQQQKDAYTKQLSELQFELKTAQKEKDTLKEQYDRQVAGIKIESRINQMLGNYKTIYDDLSPEVKGAAINALMNMELLNNEAEFYFDDKGNFNLKKKDGTNFLGDNHQEIKPQAFIEQLLSRNKLLKVTSTDQQTAGATDSSNQQQATGFNAPQNGSGNGKPQKNHVLSELAKQAQADYQKDAAFNQ